MHAFKIILAFIIVSAHCIDNRDAHHRIMSILNNRIADETTTSQILDIFNGEVDDALASLTSLTSQTWTEATAFMAETNDAFIQTTRAFASVYNESAVNDTLSNPHCEVTGYQLYISNNTKAQEYICCHLSRLIYPGILAAAEYANVFYMGVTRQCDTSPPNAIAYNAAKLKHNDLIALRTRSCLDDTRLIDAQGALVRALSTVFITTAINKHYRYITFDMNSLAAYTNQTLTDMSKFNFDSRDSNPYYSSVCSGASLYTFETQRQYIACYDQI